MPTELEQYIERKRREFGDKFDDSNLQAADHWVRDAFNKGYRVKLHDTKYGDIAMGTVSVTTGWKPSFLLIHNARSNGSSHVIQPYEKVVAIKLPGWSKYQEIARSK